MNEIISKVVPILSLIAMGYFIRKKELLQEYTIVELKKFVLNIALPAVLFKSFSTMELKADYILIFIIIFFFLCSVNIITHVINKLKLIHHPLLPFITTGSGFYLFGVPLFTSILE